MADSIIIWLEWESKSGQAENRHYRFQERKVNIREIKQNMALFKGTEEYLGKLEDAVVDQIVQPFGNNHSGVYTEKSPVINALCIDSFNCLRKSVR